MPSGYIVFFVLSGLIFGNHVFAQISPGELSKVHTHLEGISNCTKCHVLGKNVSNQKCLECHTELKTRIEAKKGYHASIEIKGKECVTCHSDHHGLNFQIIRFTKEKFNHNLTGFSLTGAHAKKLCIDCHKPDHIADQKIKKKKFTYLGLNPACLPCHTDYHQQTLSATCTECHDFEAFKPAKKFDHARAKFQLTGRHKAVTCIQCHKSTTKNGQKYQEFKGLKFDNCTPCHTDVHNNKFGQNRTQCHNGESFSVIIKGVQGFDHNKTNFKLEGKHQKVDCKSCHKTKFTNVLKHTRCTDCHADYHKTEFAKQGISPDCSQCHTVNGFQEFNFSIEQHNAGAFQLKGAHLATPCFACHKKETAKSDTAWHFKNIGKRCSDCHKDIHQTFISEKFYPNADCESCHNENKWNSISFDHKKTNFELSGAHAKGTCRDCHFKKENGALLQQFKGLPTTCEACHKDIHHRQFESNGATDCSRCHDIQLFKPASKFDHSKTLFPLDGKHKNVACVNCHKIKQENEIAFILYKIKDFKCENCHH